MNDHSMAKVRQFVNEALEEFDLLANDDSISVALADRIETAISQAAFMAAGYIESYTRVSYYFDMEAQISKG